MPTLEDLLRAASPDDASSSPLQVSLEACSHVGLREQLAALVQQLNSSLCAMSPDEAASLLKETNSSLRTRLGDPSDAAEVESPIAASRRDLLAGFDEVSEAADTELDMSSWDGRSGSSTHGLTSDSGSSTHGLTSDDAVSDMAHDDDDARSSGSGIPSLIPACGRADE
jgi:hypothetical protein